MVKAVFKAYKQKGLDTLLAYEHKDYWIELFLLATFTAVWCEKCLTVVPSVETKEHEEQCKGRAQKLPNYLNWQGATLGLNHYAKCDTCGLKESVKQNGRDKWAKRHWRSVHSPVLALLTGYYAHIYSSRPIEIKLPAVITHSELYAFRCRVCCWQFDLFCCFLNDFVADFCADFL